MYFEFETQESLMEFVMKVLELNHPDATANTNIDGCVLEVKVSGKAAMTLIEELRLLYKRHRG
jgi:hypothetical protein